VAAQCTSEAAEAVGLAVALGREAAVAEPDGDAEAEPLVCAIGVDPPHAPSVTTATIASKTPVRRSTA